MGFFSDPEELEEDDWEDFTEAAKTLKATADVYTGAVVDEAVSRHFMREGRIDRTPAFLLLDGGGSEHSINANELNDGEAGSAAGTPRVLSSSSHQ